MPSELSDSTTVTIDGLTKRYPARPLGIRRVWSLLAHSRDDPSAPSFTALDSVSFRVGRGEIVGIVGLNGSGKSTLLQCLAGVLHPSEGRAIPHGRVAAILELGAGFSTELTGRENILLMGSIFGIPSSKMDRRLPDVIAFSGLSEHIDHPVRTYSSGMFVRLAFALITQLDADIMIVDEALAVGDFRFQQKCFNYLRSANDKTRLLVSHDLNTLSALVERIIVLDKGKLVFDGPTREGVQAYLSIVQAQNKAERMAPAVKKSTTTDSPPKILPNGFIFIHDEDKTGPRNCDIESVRLKVEGEIMVPQEEAPTVRSGQNVQLEIKVRNKTSDTFRIYAGANIIDRMGQHICGQTTEEPGAEITLPPQASGMITMIFDWPPLRSGPYGLIVGVAHKETKLIECWVHNVIELWEMNEEDSHGYFNLHLQGAEFRLVQE